jgi:two-component system, chemotaxis family, CheB/CheR fusion protein
MWGVSVTEPDPEAQSFVRLLDYLKSTRGFDFSGYKASTLMRRLQKRMHEVGAADYAAYHDYLEVHPDEFVPLFDTVLINVTSFFRDPQAWSYIAEQVLPRILEARGPDYPVRCWSAGCASGEEAYTLAMLWVEALGVQEFRRRVKIYATDADGDALAMARQGIYTSAQVHDVPEEMRGKYFEKNGQRYAFRTDLRRCLIFGRHDLVQDAAISRIDLLVCRNTLMYFNLETQGRILSRLHYALNPSGYLFLGRAEMLLTHGNSFRPVDLKRRVFQRVATANLRNRLLALSPGPQDSTPAARHSHLRDAAFDHNPVAQIVVDRKGQLAMVSERARRMFGLTPGDVGRPLQDLEISYRPVELRSQIGAVYTSRMPVTLREVEWRAPGAAGSAFLEVQVTPLSDPAGALLGTSISFLDLTLPHRLQADLERANQELETAYEELQSANEELETTNEELQSTVEELETTNEELQSANEELETMNEELRVRSAELDVVNAFLDGVLQGLPLATIVLDGQLQVRAWNRASEEMWGLRRDEVIGTSFFGLDLGLPTGSLRDPVRGCLDGESPQSLDLDATNRRGRQIRCSITCATLSPATEGVVLIIAAAPLEQPA